MLREHKSNNSKLDEDDDDNNDEEDLAKNDEEDTESGKGGDKVSESEGESNEEETRQEEEESFDQIPKTPEGSEEEGSDEEDQDLRLNEEAKIQEEEEADELQTNPFVDAVSAILGIVHQYMTQQMMEAVREAVQIQTARLQDSLQRENDEFLRNIDENMKKIINGHVKSQALVKAYDADKTILDTYGESTILKRRREDDDQEGPSAGSDRGSKRRRKGGEHASASTPSETGTGSAGRSTTGSQSRQLSASESALAEEPVQTTCQMEEPSHLPRRPPSPDHDWNKTLPAAQGDAQSWISKLARQTDACSSFNELLDTPIDFSNFIMNRLGVATLTPELLAGPTYELMRGSCNSLTELEYHLEEVYKETTNQLDWVNPEGQHYPHNLLQPLSENDEFLRTIDENMKKIIKGQVKSQVKEQVLRILPRIEESVNATLEAKVLSRLSHSSRTSYAVATDLREMELKKILIEKMGGNKSIQREDDDQEGPSAGSDWGSKRRREGGEHASASTPSEQAIGSAGMSTTGTQSRQLSASEFAFVEEPVQTTCQMEEPSHPVFETGAEDEPIV
nr:hypothetical protein [Tanacetum cinerariifolium]